MKKKKKNTEEVEMENFFDVIIRNYKMVPGFRIVIKLGFYFIFIFVFLLIISIANHSKTDEIIDKTTTTKVEENLSKNYRDYISDLSNIKKEIVSINDYKLNLDIGENITGYLESTDNIKKIIIKDNQLYEIINNEEVLNSFFSNIDLTYLNIINVQKYLLNSKSIKIEENNLITYKYDNLEVIINNEKIEKIKINDNYVITYE